MRPRPLLIACLGVAACRDASLPPFGEALVVVDTDLPVPRVVSRLRTEVFDEALAPLNSRDDLRPDPRDWPVSFSVYTDDLQHGRRVLLRLRAYLEGRLDGDGEQPDARLAVDRLVWVTLTPGLRGRARVSLRGACVGVAADLPGLRSCDDGGALAPAKEVALEGSMSRDVPSEAGAFGRSTCADVARVEGRSCIPGGAFVLGDRFYRPAGETSITVTRPEKVVALSRFSIDKDEFSVGRYRGALARGFRPPLPVGATDHDAPLGAQDCTFSDAPRGREDYPLTCVPWPTADALCREGGGALPTEAQWEYVALAAERPKKALYAWGDPPPECGRAVYGRSPFSSACEANGAGPRPRRAAPGDVTELGVFDLAGSARELVRDRAAPFDAPCWSGLSDPVCSMPMPAECAADPTSLECRLKDVVTYVVRGASWASFAEELRGVARDAQSLAGSDSITGFRCVYP